MQRLDLSSTKLLLPVPCDSSVTDTSVYAFQAGGIVDKVKVAAEDKNAEGGLFAVKALADTKDATAEAYVVAMLPIVLDKYADKVCSLLFPRCVLLLGHSVGDPCHCGWVLHSDIACCMFWL